MTPMMNNPMVHMMQLLQAGQNPSAILAMMARQNPQARQVMQMMQGKTPDQLRQLAQNMARERGTTIEDVARNLGITIPSSR